MGDCAMCGVFQHHQNCNKLIPPAFLSYLLYINILAAMTVKQNKNS